MRSPLARRLGHGDRLFLASIGIRLAFYLYSQGALYHQPVCEPKSGKQRPCPDGLRCLIDCLVSVLLKCLCGDVPAVLGFLLVHLFPFKIIDFAIRMTWLAAIAGSIIRTHLCF